MTILNVLSGQKPREIAVQVLRRRDAGDDFVENLLEKEFARAQLSPPDRGLCQELVYGVVRRQLTLDWLIDRKTGAREQKPALRQLLRLGLYQTFWLDRIPPHAAVNETVELAKSGGLGAQAGFVNAVLRGYLREFDATKKLLLELKTTQPHLGHSHPEWLVARWQKRWGAEKAAQLMEWNNTPPKTFVRTNNLKQLPRPKTARKFPMPGEPINRLKTPVRAPSSFMTEGILRQWAGEEVVFDFVERDWFKTGLVYELKSHPPLATLKSFQEGSFYVQDPSTLLAVHELDPEPGETILDLCAAPGGKTTYIAQLMRNEGRVIAHDTSRERLKRVEENCARLGADCVEAVLPSALESRPATFDRILVDAPCSNTGVMRRRVDLRWRVSPEEITRLRAQQLELLRRAAPLLKPNGILVYSTCSLEPEENQKVLEQFLWEFPGFKLARERELWPFVDEVDGAFVARLTGPRNIQDHQASVIVG
jgi:16S rRNA (cytosine967-C5)-methyltransferase